MSTLHVIAIIVSLGLAITIYGVTRDNRRANDSYFSKRRMAILCTGLMVTVVIPVLVVLIGHYVRQGVQETDYGTGGDDTEITIIDQAPTHTPTDTPTPQPAI